MFKNFFTAEYGQIMFELGALVFFFLFFLLVIGKTMLMKKTEVLHAETIPLKEDNKFGGYNG
jgi:hypothetical protein